MTTARDTNEPGLTPRQVRDLIALALILAGLVGLTAIAYSWSWRAGTALLSAFTLAAGLALAYQRPER